MQIHAKQLQTRGAEAPTSRSGGFRGGSRMHFSVKTPQMLLGPAWEPSWGRFRPSWKRLGSVWKASWERLEASLERLRDILRTSWKYPGPSWCVLGTSWKHPGPSWCVLGTSWVRFSSKMLQISTTPFWLSFLNGFLMCFDSCFDSQNKDLIEK